MKVPLWELSNYPRSGLIQGVEDSYRSGLTQEEEDSYRCGPTQGEEDSYRSGLTQEEEDSYRCGPTQGEEDSYRSGLTHGLDDSYQIAKGLRKIKALVNKDIVLYAFKLFDQLLIRNRVRSISKDLSYSIRYTANFIVNFQLSQSQISTLHLHTHFGPNYLCYVYVLSVSICNLSRSELSRNWQPFRF